MQDSSTWHDHGQGAIKQTGNPLDVAIDGSAFLVVQTPSGERYTRNGSMQISPAGELVTSAGHKVLGEGGTIQFQTDDKDIAINRDGTITVPGGTRRQAAARAIRQGAATAEGRRLDLQGTDRRRLPNPAQTPHVIQGAIEQSNVKSVIEMTRMIEVTRHYTQMSSMLQQQHDMRRSSLSKLADVPA